MVICVSFSGAIFQLYVYASEIIMYMGIHRGAGFTFQIFMKYIIMYGMGLGCVVARALHVVLTVWRL